jgi:alpha/beta superfamily hydrolase
VLFRHAKQLISRSMPDVIMNGPEGRLEGRYQHGKVTNAPIALMLHPHPQHGGTMNNKVIYTIYHAFARRGFSVLRFNFRGVGRSQGRFDRGEGELSDAASALDWLQGYNPNATACWIAGFSFGAWIGMQLLMRRPEISGFISIAPPANLYDFSFLAPCPSSGLVLQGDADEIVPKESVDKLVHKLSHQRDITIDYRLVRGANHFFHDHLDALNSEIDGYLNRVMRTTKPAKAAAR